MANSSSLAAATLLLPLLLLAAAVTSVRCNNGDGDLIDQFCEGTAKTDPNVKASFCKAALDSAVERHHRARPTSAKALAVLSVEEAGVNATATRVVIKKMLAGDGGRGSAKSMLKECLEHYSVAVDRCKMSYKALKEKRIDDARTMMSSAMDSPVTCDDGFEELGEENPLKLYDGYFFQMTAIALSSLA